jgi:hypothetical protein
MLKKELASNSGYIKYLYFVYNICSLFIQIGLDLPLFGATFELLQQIELIVFALINRSGRKFN